MAEQPQVVTFRPLLSLIDGGDPWPALGKSLGINTENGNNFRDRLFRLSTVDASGVPSLFSHPFVVCTRLQAGDTDTFENFSTLIKGIFLRVINLSDVTGAGPLVQLANVARSVRPDLNSFIILEWKAKPIGGIYPDCLVFPGAQFENGEFGKDIWWDSLKDEIQRKENQLGSDIVRALFKEWLNEIALILQLGHGNNGPIWFQMLTKVMNNWITTVTPPGTALHEFTIAHTNVRISSNGGLVTIPVRYVSKNIFCEKIIKFANGKMPDFPVKSEYLNLIIACTRDGDTYHIQLNEWMGEIAWTPQEIIDEVAASVLLWPNFKSAGWNVNYVFFHIGPSLRRYNPSLKLINFDGETSFDIAQVREEEKTIPGCVINNDITHIELYCNNNPVGIFVDRRQYLPHADGDMAISLDFGTSHTCISISDGVNIMPLSLQDMTAADTLEMNLYNQNTYMQRPYWFPTFNGEFTAFPSELLFVTEDATRDIRSLSAPIRCFSITSFNRLPGEGNSETIGEFKWNEPPAFKGYRKDLVKAYLKMIMHMTLAHLRRFRNTGNLKVAPTYPLAFDKPRYDDYKKWLMELFLELATETGINVQLNITTTSLKQELIPESLAACASFDPPSYISEFVVDIGGGTTDVALKLGNKILAVESIKYGGNLFLEYLANNSNNLFPLFNIYKGDDLNVRKIILQKVIRNDGIRTIFDRYTDEDRKKAENALRNFLEGLFEYLKMLLSAHNLQDNIFLYPVGNGWRFIEGFKDSNIPTYITEWFSAKGINITVQPLHFGAKETLAVGANKIVGRGVQDDFLDLERPVRSIVGGSVTISWRGGHKTFNLTDSVPTKGLGADLTDNPKFDTQEFVKSLPFRNLPIDLNVQQIAAKLNQKCSDIKGNMLGSTGGGFSLKRSVFGRFLETIYPEHFF